MNTRPATPKTLVHTLESRVIYLKLVVYVDKAKIEQRYKGQLCSGDPGLGEKVGKIKAKRA